MDWKDLFIKYASIVGCEDGNFLLQPMDWTPDEWDNIRIVLPDIREERRLQFGA